MVINSIDSCIGHEIGVKTYSTNVIRLNSKEKAKIIYPDNYPFCQLCSIYYPVNAITITAEKSISVIVS